MTRTLELRAGGEPPGDVDLVAITVRKEAELTGVAADLDRRLGGALSRTRRQRIFRDGEEDSLFLTAGQSGDPHVLAVGAGEAPPDTDMLRGAAGRAVAEARRRHLGSLAFCVPAEHATGEDRAVQAVAEGLTVGDWSLEEFRDRERPDATERPERAVILTAPGRPSDGLGEAAHTGRIIAESQNWARALVARPGNVATPRYLEARARELAEETGLAVRSWGPERLREEGFGALLAVSRGSAEEPRFLRLEHEGAEGPPVVLVGKGVTFDSGGISLKPSGGMEDMKYDMAGAAAVLGALRAIALLSFPLRVVGLVPATENLPSGTALKPGDVIRGVSGRSIEVVNTDAEGRLILSDALAWAAGLKPRRVVDLATLTGGCVVALGHQASGLMTPDDDLATELEEAGRRAGERTWRLPLWSEYRKQLDSEIADIKNSGGREASAVTAGSFLQEFVEDEIPWAHLDIAGMAWAKEDAPGQPAGATGFGVRLLVEWLRSTT